MDTYSFNARDLRDALSTFATGVTIITTTDGAGAPVGVTASSFNSVSMDPPLVLWSVGKSAYSAPVFTSAEHFSVHILRTDQIELSNAFAKSGTDKFAQVAHKISEKEVPHLEECLARFDCKTWQVYEGGDHWIIVGKVINLHVTTGNGLVFNAGSYSAASPLTPDRQEKSKSELPDAPVENLLIYNLARAYEQMGDQFHGAVRSSGLSLAEWRVLASLQGQVTRDFADLAARTFVDPAALSDLVHSLQDAELCTVIRKDGEMQVCGTTKGHERIEHLFHLGAEQELVALGNTNEDGLKQLNKLLKLVVSNTTQATNDNA